MNAPTLDERRHLRAALGQMYRRADGVVVINPNPRSGTAHTAGVLNLRRNAKAAVVERLLFDGLLAEDHNGQITTTAAGRAVLDAASTNNLEGIK